MKLANYFLREYVYFSISTLLCRVKNGLAHLKGIQELASTGLVLRLSRLS